MRVLYASYHGFKAEISLVLLSSQINSLLKYYSEHGIPQRALESNTCAVCTNPIMILNNEEALIESTFSLPCGHMYLIDWFLNIDYKLLM